MEPIITSQRVGTWEHNKFVSATYEYRKYEEGNTVTRVRYEVIATVYDNKGAIEKNKERGSQIDLRA